MWLDAAWSVTPTEARHALDAHGLGEFLTVHIDGHGVGSRLDQGPLVSAASTSTPEEAPQTTPTRVGVEQPGQRADPIEIRVAASSSPAAEVFTGAFPECFGVTTTATAPAKAAASAKAESGRVSGGQRIDHPTDLLLVVTCGDE